MESLSALLNVYGYVCLMIGLSFFFRRSAPDASFMSAIGVRAGLRSIVSATARAGRGVCARVSFVGRVSRVSRVTRTASTSPSAPRASPPPRRAPPPPASRAPCVPSPACRSDSPR